jgi:hypothetical protein
LPRQSCSFCVNVVPGVPAINMGIHNTFQPDGLNPTSIDAQCLRKELKWTLC